MKYAESRRLRRRSVRNTAKRDYELLKVPPRTHPGVQPRMTISLRATGIREKRHHATILRMEDVRRDMAAESMKKELEYQRQLVQSIEDNSWRQSV